jgi:RimJ/RimL family protein N-acetyltransferase
MEPRFAADGIVVRPHAPADVAPMCAAVLESMATVGRWMAWCHPAYSRQEAEAWYGRCAAAWAIEGDREFGIFDAVTGDVLGCIGVNQINRINGIGNLGYWVRATREGRGIATKAAQLVARYAFTDLALTRLEIVILAGNGGSRRVAEKVGARFECVARHRLQWRGEARDAAVYGLLPADLPR